MAIDAGGGPTFDVLDEPTAGSKAIRGSGVRAVGYMAGALLALISAPLLINHLGVVEFGRYVSVISLIALASGATDVGLGALAIREYTVRTGQARDSFMSSVLGARLGLTTLGVLVATGFAALAGYGQDLVVGTLAAGLGAVLAVSAATIGVPLAAELRVGWLTAIDLSGKALSAVLVVALVLASADVLPFLVVAVPAGALTVVMTVPLTRGRVPLRPSFATAELRELMRETLALSVAFVLGTLYARIIIVLMSVIATAAATGYFGTAYRLLEVAMGIPTALVGVTFPIIARAADSDRERLKYVIQRVLEGSLILGVWMSLATALAAGPVVEVLTRDDEAAPVTEVLVILAFALAPTFLNVTWQTGLLSLRRHRELLVVNGVALVFVVGLTFVLVPLAGAPGAAVTFVAGEVLLMSASAAALLRAHPALRPELRLVPRLALATACAVAIALIPPVGPVAGTMLATGVYFGVLIALGAVPGEVLDAVRRRGDS